jgi:hypothetical protein
MQVLNHHIYEYEKGLRSLVLHTLPAALGADAAARLARRGISHHLEPLGRDKVNIFFGDPVCIEVVTRICRKPLNHLSPEEDFILGTMLGYSLLLQCRRYLQRADRRRETPTKATAFSQATHS